MKSVNLPAKNTKEEPNVIRVTNAKVEGWTPGTYDHGVVVKEAPEGSKGFVVEIPADIFSFNQYENSGEFVTDCGGEDKALEIENDFKRSASLDVGKVQIRTTTNKDINAVITAALAGVLAHTFQESDKITGVKAKEMLTDLKARAASMSNDDLAAEMRKMLGL